MGICCAICGTWYLTDGRGTLDVCGPCFELNLAGNLLESPTARHILDAYVCHVSTPGTPSREAREDYVLALNNRQIDLTPREREAMARIAETWHRQAQED